MITTSDFPRLPKLSCMCITYGRTTVLDEAIYSFLIQDYPGEKELIILNDCKELQLEGDFPNVKIYNEGQRYNSLGLKTNECISRCTGEIILIWDDDDISLPNRLSVAAKYIANKPFFKPSKMFFFSQAGLTLQTQKIPNGCTAFTKEAWQEVHGYPNKNSGLDLVFERRLMRQGMYSVTEVIDEEATYIYRWFVLPGYHTSAYGTGNGMEEATQYVKDNEIKGVYKIKPQWRLDYIRKTQAVLNAL